MSPLRSKCVVSTSSSPPSPASHCPPASNVLAELAAALPSRQIPAITQATSSRGGAHGGRTAARMRPGLGQREGVQLLVEAAVSASCQGRRRGFSWRLRAVGAAGMLLAEVIAARRRSRLPPPPEGGRLLGRRAAAAKAGQAALRSYAAPPH